jgi:predicted negative regulator of RcsB-dependent stress response
MTTASRRITRKDLKQPDWFQITSDRALEFYEANQLKVWIAAGVLVLVIAGIWGWQQFRQQQNAAASEAFMRAMTFFEAQNYRDAIPAFQKAEGYRWSRYAALGYLYESISHMDLKDLDKAISTAERFVATTSSDSLYRQVGLIQLASAEELKNNCKQAIDHYAEAERVGPVLKDKAILGKARCAEQIGDTNTALASYREYVKDQPGSYVEVKIAELEAKAPTQPAKK